LPVPVEAKKLKRPDNSTPIRTGAQEFPPDWPDASDLRDYEAEDEEATFRIQIEQVEDADDADYSDDQDNGGARR
jgi:hypothetical protein